ncbi:uncharacterized protein ASPGLDRAFT_37568 [Aspergillus glaucus CBS 516.65]|uniref:Uncharacterized protein n=1 Tax=Aspergillus glaucus CBS 516.65 TaxID=1160497 RepID=A0A1L9VEN0_ASPGL|nr:hypothetical protein ASPGLDRAFT_37568 [Aspergillus glaucus CBS 516.65]OJJ82282.1 hypothetical protein ASPGLDRAFT_37568 [Aspergillus glaucus CBS 516.65]
MGRALLTIASVLTRPPVIIMTINAINIAKYSVEQFDSSTGEKVMSIISYSTPGVFAACMAWLLWYRKEDMLATNADEETGLDSVD